MNAEDEEENEKQQALNCTTVSHQSVSMKRRFDFTSKMSGSDVVTSKKLKNYDIKTFLDREITSYGEIKGIRQIKFQLEISFSASIEVLDDFKVFEK